MTLYGKHYRVRNSMPAREWFERSVFNEYYLNGRYLPDIRSTDDLIIKCILE